MLEIELCDDDDPGFCALVGATVHTAATRLGSREVYLVRIDRWFGAAWLGFSGKLLGALGVHRLRERHVPPFHPHRVVSQRRYVWRDELAAYVPSGCGRPLHVAQPSAANFAPARRLVEWSDAATFAWYSGATRAPGDRGSLLVYGTDVAGEDAWYTGLKRDATRGWVRGEVHATTRGARAAG